MPISLTTPNNFSTLNMQDMVDTFGLQPIKNLSFGALPIHTNQKSNLNNLITKTENQIQYWNEQELVMKHLSLILDLADLQGFDYNSFAERSISSIVDGFEMSGIVDFLVAKGKYEPRNPYFFIQEFKKAKNPSGDPLPQLLGEMLVAQELNQNKVIYGTYIVGRFWYFVAMNNRDFTELSPLDSTNLEDLETILSHLNWVKSYVEEQVKK